MADLKTTTVTGDLTVSGQGKASGGAVVEGGDLTLYQPSTGNSPALVFRRGTLSDNYNDWQIQDRSGLLYFDQRGNGSSSWTNVLSIGTTGAVACQSVTISAAPTSNMQVANKKYVDDAVAGAGGGTWYGTTYTLPAAMWANNQQDASLTAMTSTCNVWVAPAHGSEEEYINCGVYASAQGADTLTFTCATTPLTAIDVSIIWIES